MNSTEHYLHSLSVNKNARLIEWNVEVLVGLLKRVVARRKASQGARKGSVGKDDTVQSSGMTIDEVCEIIQLPKFDAESAKREQDPESIELPSNVIRQLRDYVTQIAKLYRDNVSVLPSVVPFSHSLFSQI